MVPAALVLVFASAAHAAVAPLSFEQSLGQLRQDVLAVRAAQVRSATDTIGADITRLSMDARDQYWEASRLRSRTTDLRWRAQRYQPARPGQPDRDPFLRNDLQRLVWDLRDFSRASWQSAREGQRLERAAVKDGALVGPAAQLEGAAQDLVSETNWLESDARFASWDFRRAGFTSESWDIERESGSSAGFARDLQFAARNISAKVR